VTRGEGVTGNPDTGTFTYDEGSTVNYSYSVQEGYTDLAVTLDGQTVPSSGVVTMDGNHTLIANATKKAENVPTVEIATPLPGETVDGTASIKASANAKEGKSIIKMELYIDNNIIRTKAQDSFNYRWDTTKYSNDEHTIKVIAYDSENKTGEKEITVKVNNEQSVEYYTLNVVLQEGAQGTPEHGDHEYPEGSEVNYSYTPNTGYIITDVKIDSVSGNPTIGSIIMDKDRQLFVSTAAASRKK
jgi:hypothetical protein